MAEPRSLQPDRARHLSSQKLAEESGVSQSSVVKFAQKLGYKGFLMTNPKDFNKNIKLNIDHRGLSFSNRLLPKNSDVLF
jgi:DNA-binding IclR family transcriptional regulator